MRSFILGAAVAGSILFLFVSQTWIVMLIFWVVIVFFWFYSDKPSNTDKVHEPKLRDKTALDEDIKKESERIQKEADELLKSISGS